MAKTGFEKWVEKNGAEGDLNIAIAKKRAPVEQGSRGEGMASGTEARKRGRPRLDNIRRVNKLISFPVELVEKTKDFQKMNYRASFSAIVIEALSEYLESGPSES